MLRKKHIIALLEPDTSEQHGGFTERDCRAILRDEKILDGPRGKISFSERLQNQQKQVRQWSDQWAEPGSSVQLPTPKMIELPTPKMIEEALFDNAPIIWSPLADFQDVSLRMIAERITGNAHVYNSPYKQVAYVQGEIERRFKELADQNEVRRKAMARSWWPFSRASAKEIRRSANASRRSKGVVEISFDLYISRHSPRALDTAKEVNELLSKNELPLIRWTDDLKKLEECEHMLVHLDGETWTRGSESDAFAHEVREAMRKGVHRLLAHEVPGARLDDEWRRGCSFDDLIKATPLHLSEAGLYDKIAMNLAGGEWRTAGLIGLVRGIRKGGVSREKCKVEVKEPDELPADSRGSVVLARSDASHSAQARDEMETSSDRTSFRLPRPSLLPSPNFAGKLTQGSSDGGLQLGGHQKLTKENTRRSRGDATASRRNSCFDSRSEATTTRPRSTRRVAGSGALLRPRSGTSDDGRNSVHASTDPWPASAAAAAFLSHALPQLQLDGHQKLTKENTRRSRGDATASRRNSCFDSRSEATTTRPRSTRRVAGSGALLRPRSGTSDDGRNSVHAPTDPWPASAAAAAFLSHALPQRRRESISARR